MRGSVDAAHRGFVGRPVEGGGEIRYISRLDWTISRSIAAKSHPVKVERTGECGEGGTKVADLVAQAGRAKSGAVNVVARVSGDPARQLPSLRRQLEDRLLQPVVVICFKDEGQGGCRIVRGVAEAVGSLTPRDYASRPAA